MLHRFVAGTAQEPGIVIQPLNIKRAIKTSLHVGCRISGGFSTCQYWIACRVLDVVLLSERGSYSLWGVEPADAFLKFASIISIKEIVSVGSYPVPEFSKHCGQTVIALIFLLACF